MSLFKTKKLPFIIHYCGTKQECTCKDCQGKDDKNDEGLFPTHTHGLDKLGYPEIFIDPLAFAEYNATIIRGVYEYLSEPGRENLIRDLVNGKIIDAKLSRIDKNFLFMAPVCKDLIICMRIVYSDFEAVRLAYGDEVPAKIPFIQLYVLGDDFALDDEYYRGGVTW